MSILASMAQGYKQREELRRFKFVRKVPVDVGGTPIDIVVDFLIPCDAEIVKDRPPILSAFAVQRADGADLALRFYQLVAISGDMPEGSTNREIAVARSLPCSP